MIMIIMMMVTMILITMAMIKMMEIHWTGWLGHRYIWHDHHQWCIDIIFVVVFTQPLPAGWTKFLKYLGYPQILGCPPQSFCVPHALTSSEARSLVPSLARNHRLLESHHQKYDIIIIILVIISSWSSSDLGSSWLGQWPTRPHPRHHSHHEQCHQRCPRWISFILIIVIDGITIISMIDCYHGCYQNQNLTSRVSWSTP